MSSKCQEQPVVYDYVNPNGFDLRITTPENQQPDERHSANALLGSNSSVSVSAASVALELIPHTTPNENLRIMNLSVLITCADRYSMTMKDDNGTTVFRESVIKTMC